MSFSLRYRAHNLDLPVGRFIIGRASDAQLSLDDRMVSRHHAVITVAENSVQIEDLDSRNGTQVNGQPIKGAVSLQPGDVVKIGSQELVLASSTQGVPSARVAATLRFDRLGVMGELADKALSLGRAEEAERLIGQTLKDIASEVSEGRQVDRELCVKATRFAVRLAGRSGKGAWVDYAIRLFHDLGAPLPSDIVDALHEVMRKVGPVDLPALRAYVRTLRERSEQLSPSERFLLSRIEGLERMASLR